MQGNYEKILGKIAQISGLEQSEVERRVEAKRSKLSGLISLEGAAQIVAAELGVSFEEEKLKIDELLSGMRKINVVGKIIRLFPVRTFTTKKGDQGKVVNFVLADDTSNIKVVLWDTNHIALIENGTISQESVIEIVNGSMRDNEIHLGSFSEFKVSSEVIGEVVTEKKAKEKTISEFRVGDSAMNRAFIVQAFEPRFFYVCPECSKKAVSGADGFVCSEHGKVNAQKRALITLVIDDGTENIRAVVFHENLKYLGFSEVTEEVLVSQKREVLGKEFMFKGNVKMNNYFNNPELVIEEISEPDMDGVIATLEKR